MPASLILLGLGLRSGPEMSRAGNDLEAFGVRFVIKIVITLCVVLFCTEIGRKLPSLAGLIAVMPLTGLVVLVWLYLDNPGNAGLVAEYCKGALWGIVPSTLFFFVALVCFRKRLSLPLVLCASFAVWSVAALIHQWLLSK